MLITYNRTHKLPLLGAVAGTAFAVLAVTVAIAALLVVSAVAAAVFFARGLLRGPWRRDARPPPSTDTIEGTLVTAASSDTQRSVKRLPFNKGSNMRSLMMTTFCVLLASTNFHAANEDESRLQDSGFVIEEILAVADNIPQQLLDKAKCIVVIPSMLKEPVDVGSSYAGGTMACRKGPWFDGPWSAPAMYALGVRSFGPRLDERVTDIVVLVTSIPTANALLYGEVTLGGSSSVAAGPTRGDLAASTDATMRAEILGYSRSRGLFAGASLEGTSLRPDDDASGRIYGRRLTAHTIVTGDGMAIPAAGRRFVAALEKNAPRNESQRAAR